MHHNLGFYRHLPMPFEETVGRVRQALGSEGFSIAGDLDLQSVLAHSEMDHRPALHLTVFDPQIAHDMLQIGTDLGVLLLLQVIILARADSESSICIADPMQALAPMTTPKLKPIAEELNRRLWRVFVDVVTAPTYSISADPGG